MIGKLANKTMLKLAVATGFVAACLALLGYFYVSMGGHIPGIAEEDDYKLSFTSSDIDNLMPNGEVRLAGVTIGRVTDRVNEGDKVRVSFDVQPEFAPLHRGVKLRVGLKGLVGDSYVEVVDGKGPPIPSGTAIPGKAVGPSVQVHNVIAGLKPKTRKALSSSLQSLGRGTKGQGRNVDQLMDGLGRLGREGTTALDAIAAQSEDLKALAGEATQLLNALDTGRGQIASVVRDANTLTKATAGQRQNLEKTVRQLPGTLVSARAATGDLTELSGSLAPVTADLRRAAPNLDQALRQLPAVTKDVRGLLPALNGVLDSAPATLDRVPTLGSDVRGLVPPAQNLLADANPMLAYLKPYGRDLGAMLANFGASFESKAEDGLNTVRLAPIINSGSVRNMPLPVEGLDPTHWSNPYPKPGQAGNPAPFTGPYPRVERTPR